jgi:hypothetical protein
MDELLSLGIFKGVSTRTIDKLLKAGYIILKSVAVIPAKEISKRAKVGIDMALKVTKLVRIIDFPSLPEVRTRFAVTGEGVVFAEL